MSEFKCKECGKEFQYERSLKRHMLNHDTKKYTCGQCSQTFTRQDLLSRHEKTCKQDISDFSNMLKYTAICQDEALNDVLQKNEGIINIPHEHGKLMSHYNFPLPFELQTRHQDVNMMHFIRI